MTSWISIVITCLIALVICLFAVVAVNYVLTITAPQTNSEYVRYVHIRDFSNCTKNNDTYCKEIYHVCIHGYEYCQRQQCPDNFP